MKKTLFVLLLYVFYNVACTTVKPITDPPNQNPVAGDTTLQNGKKVPNPKND